MAEYINRTLAKAEFTGNFRDEYPTALIHALIDSVPAADVASVRHGRWFMRGGKWRCSECDQKALLRLSDATGGCREYEYYRANYCPNCGCRMDLEVTE